MAVTLAAGYPTFSGITIPELYPVELLIKIYAKTVVSKICSTDHQDELKKAGDVAHIRLVPTLTRKTGSIGADMVPNVTAFTSVDLVIDQLGYFDEEVDNIIAKQSNIDILNTLQDAIAKSDAVATDAAVLAGIATTASSANEGATAGTKTSSYDLGASTLSVAIADTNALDKLLDLIAVLKEQNVDEDIWCVIPSWYARKLKSSDLKQANEMGDNTSVARSGLLGKIDGVEIWESNNMTGVSDTYTCWYAHAGHKSAIAFAETISDLRVVEPTERFAKQVQMQTVYGYKTVNPDYLATLYCRPSA